MTMVYNYDGPTMYTDDAIIDYDDNNTYANVFSKYIVLDRLEIGSYGTVCSAFNRMTSETVTIKKISNVFNDDKTALMALTQLKLLRHIRHPNVIALKDVLIPYTKSTFQDVYLVYELMHYDLHRINRSIPLSNDIVKYLIFQLLNGLNYLHSANIIHRDLKPQNLLLNENWDLKISDFGLARTNTGREQPLMDDVRSLWYRTPEVILCGEDYGPSIDVWSLDCILAELLGRQPIFQGQNDLDQVRKIIGVVVTQRDCDLRFVKTEEARSFLKSLPYTPANYILRLFPKASADAFDLLWKMLEFNPKSRITVSQALKHRCFADLWDLKVLGDAPLPCDLDLGGDIGVDKIRSLIWSEMKLYRRGMA